jgi:hypothetical protein
LPCPNVDAAFTRGIVFRCAINKTTTMLPMIKLLLTGFAALYISVGTAQENNPPVKLVPPPQTDKGIFNHYDHYWKINSDGDGQYTINCGISSKEEMLVRLLDGLGQIVWEEAVESTKGFSLTFSLSNAAPGLYTIEIGTSQMVSRKKLELR